MAKGYEYLYNNLRKKYVELLRDLEKKEDTIYNLRCLIAQKNQEIDDLKYNNRF